MKPTPPSDPCKSLMLKVFDFTSRPGIAMVRPEIARRLAAACRPPEAPPMVDATTKPAPPSDSFTSPMLRAFDFTSRPGIAMVRPEIGRQLVAACRPPSAPAPAIVETASSEQADTPDVSDLDSDPNALRKVIYFSVRPGVASVRPDIARQLSAASRPPSAPPVIGAAASEKADTFEGSDLEHDPHESEDYQRFVESMVEHCRCSASNCPCEGVLAGGLCDTVGD